MDRRRLAIPAALALLTTLVVPLAAPAAAQPGPDEPEAPRGEDWRMDARIQPGEGFTVTTTGTVDGRQAEVVRSFDVDEATLTITYTLGDPDDPDRHVSAEIAFTGAYVFEDVDDDGRFDLSDDVREHARVDPGASISVTPVRASHPLESSRALIGLEDGAQLAVTMTTTRELSVQRGSGLTPTETRLNVSVAGLGIDDDAHVGIVTELRAASLADASQGQVRLDGTGAGLVHEWLGPLDAARADAGASLFEDRQPEGESARATLVVAEPAAGSASHETETRVVHAGTGLEAVSEVVGEPGTFLLGLLGATALVGAAAWRKLQSGT